MSKQTPPAPPPDSPPAPPPALVQARVLTACAWGVNNDVVSVTAEQLAQGQADGELDGAEAAVAYALSLQSGA